MKQRIFVKPGIGSNGKPLRVLDIHNRPIPVEGQEVQNCTFISRMLTTGDLVQVGPRAPEAKTVKVAPGKKNEKPQTED